MNTPSARYYDSLSEHYDNVTSQPGVWTPPKFMADIISSKIEKGTKLLDVGIGTGQLIEQLRDKIATIEIHGIDVSKKMLDICSIKFPNICLYDGDYVSINIPFDRYFDIITICGALEFIEDLNTVFRKSHSLLFHSGHLVFTYEPQIMGHDIQNEKRSLAIPSDRNSHLSVEEFYTYRHSSGCILNSLKNNGFTLIEDSELVAYKKSGKDIIYHLIVAQKDSKRT